MTERGSLSDCKICAEEMIQSTARQTGNDRKNACKSRMEDEPGSLRQETILPVLRDRKKWREYRQRYDQSGFRQESEMPSGQNCKEAVGNNSEKTVTGSENFARLLVLFLGTGTDGNRIAR
jgi:hypothetical protein